LKIRVYYEDTDAGGVVYHTNYIKFCERARSEIFFKNGVVMDEENGYFVVSKLECSFLKSAKLGDLLEVKTKLIKIKKASLILEQIIFKNEEIIFKQIATLAYLKNSKLTKIEKEKIELFQSSL